MNNTKRTFADRLADRIILMPTRDAIPVEEQVGQYVSTDFGQVRVFRRLVGCGVDQPIPRVRFLKAPGTGGRAERSTEFPANLLRGVPAEVVAWNPPGYGDSSGVARLADLVPALMQVVDSLHDELAIPTIGIGNSLGSCTVLGLAARRPLHGLILRNIPPLKELCRQRDRWWNFWRGGSLVASGVPAELDAMQTAPHVTAPAIFLHSRNDTLVPVELQQQIVDLYAGPKQQVFLDDCDHDTPMDENHLAAFTPTFNWLLHQVLSQSS